MFQYVALDAQAEASPASHANGIVIASEDVIALLTHIHASCCTAKRSYKSDDPGSCALVTASKDTCSDPVQALHAIVRLTPAEAVSFMYLVVQQLGMPFSVSFGGQQNHPEGTYVL